ncbi:TPA: HigA family addiction module antidote protein, partial [Escherichia coli]|nr:HigA family addiction module antidote protein [Escherichia coli]HEL8126688.1 HigA family addiction module antidote protein [Escherichia coli]HEL8386153.1 HigA family addiction module antidote protein [Escherichia coli]HEM0129912.1 HigA family addiction module antidote protein [Escherichia coli]HEM0196147.1 HigA family addiction module antidote protein [Escherichia coli]
MKMANPAHPGQIISETLEDMNIPLRKFARAMEIAPSTASRLLSGHTAVTPEMAIRLSMVIGSTPETWLKIQN